MSSVVISGDTSGAITLAAPAVAGTNTITLPASTGTVLTTGSPQSGGVLQVVSGASKTYISSSTTSYIDITGITASITPKFTTSKILVKIGISGLSTNTNITDSKAVAFRLVDGSNTLIQGVFDGFVPGANQTYGLGSFTYEFLHSPATISSITYKIQGQGNGAGNGFQVNNYASNASFTGSYITLMEIAA
jgi:hypothetical protein